MKYTYSVARFVPNPTRGEFINIAVVVVGDNEMIWKEVESYDRAKMFGTDSLLEHCRSRMLHIFEEEEPPSPVEEALPHVLRHH